MRFIPRWIKDLLKQSKKIVSLHKKYSWQLHLFKDWWGTKVWKNTSEVMTPLGFKLVSGFHPAYRLMREGNFEIEETAIIIRMLDHVDIFVDVGANLGYYTCLASKHGKYVISFEPQQQNLKCLMRNLTGNGYQEQVEVFPLALSAKPGLLTLFGASGPSASLIKGWAGYSSRHSQVIPVSTLDNVLGERFIDLQLFVKIDVEGAEYQVLEGSHEILGRAKKPVWLLEICLQEFHPLGQNPDYKKIFDLFWAHGYLAYTATEPPRFVDQSVIAAWLKNKTSEHSTFNYIFVSEEMSLANSIN
jgi:FkbM family methyltransferase